MQTYIQDPNVLHELIKTAQKYYEERSHLKYTGHYLNVLIPHYTLLSDDDKKIVRTFCFNMSEGIRGVDTPAQELCHINRVKGLPGFDSVQKDLASDIEAMSVKNGNDVVYRYVTALFWDVTLHNDALSHIDDKTTYPVKGWLSHFILEKTKNYSNITSWLYKRFLVAPHKNTSTENINMLLSFNLSSLNKKEMKQFFAAVDFIYDKQIHEIAIDDIITLHNKIGKYLDTKPVETIMKYYKGLPDAVLSQMPVDNVYVQKYAVNRFFVLGSGVFAHSGALNIPSSFFDENRVNKEQPAENYRKCQIQLLKNVINGHSFEYPIVPMYYLQHAKMGYKVLFLLSVLMRTCGMKNNSWLTKELELLPILDNLGKDLKINMNDIITDILKSESADIRLNTINRVLQPFLTSLCEKLRIHEILYEIPKLSVNDLELSIEDMKLIPKVKFQDMNWEHCVTIYEDIVRDMGTDLGYTDEEIELLF